MTGARGDARFFLAALARFALSSRNPDRGVPRAPAACGEDVVSAIGSSIDETTAMPLLATSTLGALTLLLTSP